MKSQESSVNCVFVVGTPGAGKTTFCEVLDSALKKRVEHLHRIGDYPYLQELFMKDMRLGNRSRFIPDPNSQFEVIDPVVYDEAMALLHDELILRTKEGSTRSVSVIEFSRPAYDSSFRSFSVGSLLNSVVCHVTAPIETCNQRNEGRRVALERKLNGSLDKNTVFDDDPDLHYVPESVMRRFYAESRQVDEERQNAQALVLNGLPFRGYFRIDNSDSGREGFSAKARELVDSSVVPLVLSKESLSEKYLRRFQALRDYIHGSEYSGAVFPDSESSQRNSVGFERVSMGSGCELEGSTDGFDVFLAHNESDKLLVMEVCESLKKSGLRPWIDSEQIPPGSTFQQLIQSGIRSSRSAAIFIGLEGLGRWQNLEARAVVSQCVERGISVIPVLLPGIRRVPQELTFLNDFAGVSFQEHVGEEEAMEKLKWGIRSAVQRP